MEETMYFIINVLSHPIFKDNLWIEIPGRLNPNPMLSTPSKAVPYNKMKIENWMSSEHSDNQGYKH